MQGYQLHAYAITGIRCVFLPYPDSVHRSAMRYRVGEGVPALSASPGHARHLYAYPPSCRRRR